MYISKLEVDGFRSLTNVKIEDMQPITLFFGRNGAGKSSILAFLTVLFSPKVRMSDLSVGPTIGNQPFYRGIIQDFVNNYKDNEPRRIDFNVTISIPITELNNIWPENKTNNVAVFSPDNDEKLIKLRIEGYFHPSEDNQNDAEIVLVKATLNNKYIVYDETKSPTIWIPHESQSTLSLSEAEALGETLLSNFTGLFSNIGIARFLHKELVMNNTTIFPDQQPLDRLDSFKSNLFRAKQSLEQERQTRYRRICSLFSSMTPWGEIDFAQSKDDITDIEVMSWDKDSLWLPISMRGAGAEQLLVILSEVVLRDSKIIGIEELESNLDEVNQGNLMDLLRNNIGQNGNTGQIIASAHSCFYGYDLDPKEKKWVVQQNNGNTIVKAWSKAAKRSLFNSSYDSGPARKTKPK